MGGEETTRVNLWPTVFASFRQGSPLITCQHTNDLYLECKIKLEEHVKTKDNIKSVITIRERLRRFPDERDLEGFKKLCFLHRASYGVI